MGELGANEAQILFPVTPGLFAIWPYQFQSAILIESPKYIRFKGKRSGKDTYLVIAIVLIQ